MKLYRNILVIMVALLTLFSCVKAEFEEKGSSTGDGEVWLTLDFGSRHNTEIVTKATVSPRNENQIYNFYIFVFDRDGAKITGQYFDSDNLKATTAELDASNVNCWYVNNATNDTDITSGSIKLLTAPGNGMKIYMIANLDSDMVRISSDLLASNIHSEEDLQDFNVFLNQNIVNRNGYFPMSGRVTDVAISNQASNGSVHINRSLSLKRLDAKIKFKFKTGNRPDANNGQIISKFEPQQWKVVNVPRTAYLLDYEDRGISDASGHDYVSVNPNTNVGDYSIYAKDFFDTDFVNFEEHTSSTEAEFSFYMMENRQNIKKPLNNYQNRSKSLKMPNGTNSSTTVSYVLNGVPYEKSMRVFEYANDFSTYVVVTGRVEMNLLNDSAGQVLGGEVQYIIHLGDWNSVIDEYGAGGVNDSYSGFDNFNTERNTSYTYNVTVNSVNNIRVEVETSKGDASEVIENQPGATGSITVAKEDIILCDCHYETRSIELKLANFFQNSIDREHCIADELTWRVKTPFSDGQPIKVGDGMDITTGLDYNWVKFRLNKKDANGNFIDIKRKYTNRPFASMNEWQSASTNKEGDGSDGLAGYHNDGVMDITALIQYVKRQVNRYLDSPEASDFDHPDDPSQAKLRFTVFVDEYYYESNPINNEKDPLLWKSFVNAEPRQMHILCSSNVSKDLESRATGSVITIKQEPITSIFNTSKNFDNLHTAWGLEGKDEFDGALTYWSTTSAEQRGNNSQSNGLHNTAKEWGLCNRYDTSFKTGSRWDTYIDFETSNEEIALRDTYKYLRYSCMTRNRDNNGNGMIDREELRWYMASVRQLIGMYVGDGLLSNVNRLYNKSPEDRASSDVQKWQQHVISSDCTQSGDSNSNNPTVIWAEEGISTSVLNVNWNYIKNCSIRCIRNLGYIDGNSEESYSLDKEPEDYIQWETLPNGNFLFTTTRLNEQALRYYTSRELTVADEHSIENRLYKQFEVLKEHVALPDYMTFDTFNNSIDESLANGQGNPYCPEGYRAPSQLEVAIIRYYLGNEGKKNSFTRTTWSFGAWGKYDKGIQDSNGLKYGFIIAGDNNITVNRARLNRTRCVRDIRVN